MMPSISLTVKYFLPQSRWKMRRNSLSWVAALSSPAWALAEVANAEMGSSPIIRITARISDSNLFRGDRVCVWFILFIPFLCM